MLYLTAAALPMDCVHEQSLATLKAIVTKVVDSPTLMPEACTPRISVAGTKWIAGWVSLDLAWADL